MEKVCFYGREPAAFKLYTGLDMPAQELKAFLAKREEEGVEPLADVAENVPF